MALVRELPARTAAILPSTISSWTSDSTPVDRVELLGQSTKRSAHVPDSVAAEVYTVRELVDAVRSAGKGAGNGRSSAGWDTVLADRAQDPDVVIVDAHPASPAPSGTSCAASFIYSAATATG